MFSLLFIFVVKILFSRFFCSGWPKENDAVGPWRVYPQVCPSYFAKGLCEDPSLLFFLSSTWKRSKLKVLQDKLVCRCCNPNYTRFLTKRRSSRVEPVLGTLLNYHNMKRVNTRGKKREQTRSNGGPYVQSEEIPKVYQQKSSAQCANTGPAKGRVPVFRKQH